MSADLSTKKGQEQALKALEARKKKNAKEKRNDNSRLPAGSPMYYYCRGCSGVADVLPESHMSSPKKFCNECQPLKDAGLIE